VRAQNASTAFTHLAGMTRLEGTQALAGESLCGRTLEVNQNAASFRPRSAVAVIWSVVQQHRIRRRLGVRELGLLNAGSGRNVAREFLGLASAVDRDLPAHR
jgi:hypothetical protein